MFKNFTILFSLFLLTSCASNLVKTKSFDFDYTVPPLIQAYSEAESIGFTCLSSDAKWCRDKMIKCLHPSYNVNSLGAAGTDLSFRISTYTRVITPEKTETKTTQKTDKDGNPYTVTTVTKKAKYAFSVRVELLDQNGSLLRVVEKKQDEEIKESASTLEKANKDFGRKFTKQKQKKYESASILAYQALENEFLKDKKYISASPLAAKSKKHDYNDLNSAANSQVEWMQLLIDKKDSISNPTIKELIEVYDEIISEMNTHSRKARVNKKVGAACYHNLALLYLSVNDRKKTLEYMNKSKELKSINSVQTTIVNDFNKIKNRTGF